MLNVNKLHKILQTIFTRDNAIVTPEFIACELKNRESDFIEFVNKHDKKETGGSCSHLGNDLSYGDELFRKNHILPVREVADPVKRESGSRDEYYPLWITTECGKHFYVAVDRKSGKVSVGGDADSTDAAKIFLESLGDLSPIIVPNGWQLVPVKLNPEMRRVLVDGVCRVLTCDGAVDRYYNDILGSSPKREGGRN